MWFILSINRERIKSRGSFMLRPSQPKTVFYETASVTSCLLGKHFIRVPSIRTLHRVPLGFQTKTHRGVDTDSDHMANWEGDFKSQELFLHGITAPKHSFSPPMPKETVPSPTEPHFQPPEGFFFFLKPKFLFLQYHPGRQVVPLPGSVCMDCDTGGHWPSGLVAGLKAET